MKSKLTILLLLCASWLFANGGTGNFQIVGTKIIDPQGNEFIPKGVNVSGMKWVWPGNPVPHAAAIADHWGFNLIRVNCRLVDAYWNGENVSQNSPFQTILSMKPIVDEFTARNVVVMFEFHDKTGSYYLGSDLEMLKNAWRDVMRLYGNNPYVWFNIMNEPGGNDSPARINDWVLMHQEVIKVIRDEWQNKNVIVVDAHFWGQDAGVRSASPVLDSNSSILSAGNHLINFNGKTYENIMFSIHVYDHWNSGTPEQVRFKLHDYIQSVKDKGFALMIGEYGTNAQNGSLYYPEAFRGTMDVAPAHGVGLLWWHWYGGDALKLTTTGNGNGANINHPTNPTNLTWPGQMVWNHNHFSGNQPPFVTLYNPIATQMVLAGSDIGVFVAAADYDDGIEEVRIYVNNNVVANLTNEPYEYVIPNATSGRYALKAVARDKAGNESESSLIYVNVNPWPHKGSVLFVTGSEELTELDNVMFNEILKEGFTVFHRTQQNVLALHADDRVAVVLSSSVTSSQITEIFRSIDLPVFVGNSSLFPGMKLTGNIQGVDYGTYSGNTVKVNFDSGHSVTSGLNDETLVYPGTDNIGFGKPASGATIITTSIVNPDQATLFYYESGAAMIDISATGSRAGWFGQPNVELSETAILLFRHTLKWLITGATSINDVSALAKKSFDLSQNYPNPIREHSSFNYSLLYPAQVRIDVVDQLGVNVKTIVNDFHNPGEYTGQFTRSCFPAPGVYFYRMVVNGESIVKSVVVK